MNNLIVILKLINVNNNFNEINKLWKKKFCYILFKISKYGKEFIV